MFKPSNLRSKFCSFPPRDSHSYRCDIYGPALFKLFIDDIPGMFSNLRNPIKLENENVPCLLYADDLVSLSKTKEGLQQQFDIFCMTIVMIGAWK